MKTPEMKYVVTAYNKLSDERIAITSPHKLDVAWRIRNAFARQLHRYSVYKTLKVEPEDRQLRMF